MTTTCLATARTNHCAQEQAIIDALETHVASTTVTELIDTLRAAAFGDAYIAAALLAGVKTLMRGLPDAKPFAALLATMEQEVSDGR